MKRILYYTDTLMAGGIERQLSELLLHLDRSRFQPYVIYLYGDKVGYGQHFRDILEAAGIPVIALDLRLTPYDKLRAILKIIQVTWRLRPDIIHALNYHSNLLTRLSRPFLPWRLKLLGAVRNAATPKQLLYERLSVGLCSTVVCNSPHLQQQLVIDARIPAHKVIVIPNGVDTARFAHNPDPDLRARCAAEDSMVFVAVGRISHQKAQHLLVEAVGRLDAEERLKTRVQCWFVGEIHNPEAESQFNDVLKQYPSDLGIRRFPATHQPESFYHASDVVVLASLWEGMPNVALEALAASRPVIISEAANAAGIIQHNRNGWVVRTGDVDHLAETLYTVMQLPRAGLQAMHEDCRQTAMQYSVDAMVDRYHLLYEQL